MNMDFRDLNYFLRLLRDKQLGKVDTDQTVNVN